MSEVDSLSHSGLYAALPLGDQRRKDGAPEPPPRDPAADHPDTPVPSSRTNAPRPRKSLIDEYA